MVVSAGILAHLAVGCVASVRSSGLPPRLTLQRCSRSCRGRCTRVSDCREESSRRRGPPNTALVHPLELDTPRGTRRRGRCSRTDSWTASRTPWGVCTPRQSRTPQWERTSTGGVRETISWAHPVAAACHLLARECTGVVRHQPEDGSQQVVCEEEQDDCDEEPPVLHSLWVVRRDS